MTATVIDADWLRDAVLQSVLAALDCDGEEAMIVGGAVRNHLMSHPISDVDIATTAVPEETIARADKAGFKTVPMGIEHGTVMVVAGHHGFEVTTLRHDIETDGRRAKVAFGRDFEADANRRDFTVNALYVRSDGTIFDPVGGLADIETRTIRFIGDAEQRIREDYLRILRFFRFFARYGGGRPDSAGLLACTRLKDGVSGLSAERVWMEMQKLLSAPDPSRALLWMRQSGVLNLVLPESEKWGIDAIHGVIDAEVAFKWDPDALFRLMSIIPGHGDFADIVARRWKVSNAERERLTDWAGTGAIAPQLSDADLAKRLYRGKPQAICDHIRLSIAAGRARAQSEPASLEDVASLVRLLRFAENWKRPKFPVTGSDMMAAGFGEGPHMGNVLRELERRWIDNGFKLSRETLLKEAKDRLS
jgi:tRNA nucleotidyltransferase/poly(A) polymerase